MRVLFDHQSFSLQDVGGISRYFVELMKGLAAEKNVSCDFFMGWNSQLLGLENSTPVRQFKISPTGQLHAGRLRYAFNEIALSIAAPALGKYDIYHSTHCRQNRFVRRRRLVVTHHDCAYERFPELFSSASLVKQLRGEIFHRADAIICVSQATRRDLLEFYEVEAQKISVIYHGVTKFAAQADHPGFCSRPYLLYVGSRATYKNFQGFLKAFALARLASEFSIVVLGGGPLTSPEAETIEALGIRNHVICEPWVRDEGLAAAYEGAHLLIYPSLYEGFGFPPLEAMSHGCPVLVSNSSSLPEVCGDAAFYFEPPQFEDLAKALLRACLDDTARAEKKALGMSASARFTWKTCIENTRALYQSLCP